jgi:hypothetical protein
MLCCISSLSVKARQIFESVIEQLVLFGFEEYHFIVWLSRLPSGMSLFCCWCTDIETEDWSWQRGPIVCHGIGATGGAWPTQLSQRFDCARRKGKSKKYSLILHVVRMNIKKYLLQEANTLLWLTAPSTKVYDECVFLLSGRILTKFLGVHWGCNRKRWSCRVHPEAGRTRCLRALREACIAAQNNAQRVGCKWWSPMTRVCNRTKSQFSLKQSEFLTLVTRYYCWTLSSVGLMQFTSARRIYSRLLSILFSHENLNLRCFSFPVTC